MRKILKALVFLGVAGAAIAWLLSRPSPVPAEAVAGLVGDATRGEPIFWAAGCASCHAAPKSEGDAKLVLSGGYRIDSPFGTFIAPNISPSPQGIAGWSTHDLANALIAGTSPRGAHYYPSLPYTTYTHMQLQDVADLKAFLDTLPPSSVASQAHELGFPFTIRRTLGLWKRLFLKPDWVVETETEVQTRGRYLVEALSHCAECHTPRNVIGGLDKSKWLQGAPNPSGKGRIPAINSANLTWSADDIAYYLETGFTPDFDSAGGNMVSVIANMSKLSSEDRAAIAAYLKLVP